MAENAFQHRKTVGVEDFVLLDDFRSEDAFVDNLRKRFQEDLIYTYIGSVLVSVNPYKELNIYDARHMERYRGQNFYELPPHVFAIADTAYRAVIHEYRDECILISGESGSGKTEASKKILQYIAQASRHAGTVDDVKEKLLACNPLFEAFGNAKTKRNDNSSRFGKYMDIEVGVQGFPVGGHVLDYLLERTRVVYQTPGERNFHIFYQLLSGVDRKTLDHLKLTGDWRDYSYLNQKVVKIDTGNTGHEELLNRKWKEGYEAVMQSLEAIHFTMKEREELLTTVAAILHLGNVRFVEGGDYAQLTNPETVNIVANLLGCSRDSLIQALTHRGVHAQQDKVLAKNNREQATTSRDSLAKAIYAKTFDWLVKRVNKALAAKEKTKSAVIGLLDIYGFEVFEQNSFEQFCINYCNEKLQQLFIELTLRSEQEEYISEGISWESVDYFDNHVICHLIEAKPFGLIPLLDDECLRPGNATDMTYLDKILEKQPKHPHCVVRKDTKQFLVKHYAGDVLYNVEGFLEKNGELLHRDLKELVVNCNNDILRAAFSKEEATSLKRSLSTATQFKNSLAQLMIILKSKDPFYIRCIRPNDGKVPRQLSDAIVRHQVKYLGLMENLRVRRAGFAYRRPYETFLRRYKSLCPATWPHPNFGSTPKQSVLLILNHLQIPPTSYSLGKTKIFMRLPQTIFGIEDAFQERKNELATKIIAIWRGHRQLQLYQKTRQDIIAIQTQIRGYLAREQAKKRRQAVKTLREFIKGFITRNEALTNVNRKFWMQTRMNYLNKLAKGQLPKTVLDKTWPECPPSMKETSELLRKLHMKNRILTYCKNCAQARKRLLQEKVTAERLFKDKKAMYPSTIPKFFVPIRLDVDAFTAERMMCFENTIRLPKEVTIYATDCVKFDRSGFKRRPRTIVLTSQHLYILEPHKDNYTRKNAYPLNCIIKIIVSSNKDSVVILSVVIPENGSKPEKKDDYIFHLPNVIEFVTKFVELTHREDVLEIIPSGKRSLTKNGMNGSFVQFGVGSVEHIAPVKKSLQIVAQN